MYWWESMTNEQAPWYESAEDRADGERRAEVRALQREWVVANLWRLPHQTDYCVHAALCGDSAGAISVRVRLSRTHVKRLIDAGTTALHAQWEVERCHE
jgi:hypothetical protein